MAQAKQTAISKVGPSRKSPTASGKRPSRAPAGLNSTMAINGNKPERHHQQDVMHRLRRVEGQIRGILAMMEKEQPCDAIAQQLSAARKALDRAFYEMMACSLESEITERPDADPAELTARIAEKTKLLAKYA